LQRRVEEAAARRHARCESRFELVAKGHQLVDLRDDITSA